MHEKNRSGRDIVGVAAGDPRFQTLVAAIQAAGLVETLRGAGPFTLFAPTADAFGRLPDGTVAGLLQPDKKQDLTAVLTYHVVAGSHPAADILKMTSGTKVATVDGQPVTIEHDARGVRVNQANVIVTDVQASNGMIHAIDRVLLPGAR